MAKTIEDVHLRRWRAFKATGIPYTPEHAIPTFWREHPELGSPIAVEEELDDGTIAQAFTGGVVVYQDGLVSFA